jgi:fatty acid desaturase
MAFLRLILLGAVLVGGCWLHWSRPLGPVAIAVLLPAGAAYALLLIATHEMAHDTLLGWPRFEFALGCLLSWPMAWPFATYRRVHRLHHRWNGSDPRDPERTDVLPAEYRQAGALRRWFHDHVLVGRSLILGGVGLIVDTTWMGWHLRRYDASLEPAQRLDGLGVWVVQASLLILVLSGGALGRYVLFWLVLERVIGAIVQFRGLIEHHGLWRSGPSHLLTQLYATRSVVADAWLNACMGGLPHHSAHHAFPWIPSQRLPEASRRLGEVLERHGWPPLPRLSSYGAGLMMLTSGPGTPP